MGRGRVGPLDGFEAGSLGCLAVCGPDFSQCREVGKLIEMDDTFSDIGFWDVWASGPDDAFAVGSEGTIVHYDGTAWTPMTSGVDDHLFGVWGSGPSDVFAVGDQGIILHYDGDDWSEMTSTTPGSDATNSGSRVA